MPKIGKETGPTYAGHEGAAVDAYGALYNVDPSRNADGTVVDGYESQERDLQDQEGMPTEPERQAEPGESAPPEPNESPEIEPEPEQTKPEPDDKVVPIKRGRRQT